MGRPHEAGDTTKSRRGRRDVLRVLTAAGGFLFTAGQAMAQTVKVRLGTATQGGGFPVYGAAFVEAVRRFDAGLEIEAINTRGSTENVPLLEAGTLDIALVQGEVVHEALQGLGRTPADLRVLTAMYPTAGMFVVRASLLLELLAETEPEMVQTVVKLAEVWHTDARADALAELWPALHKVAIDYSVAEPAAARGLVAVVPAAFAWRDLGDWAAAAQGW